MNNNNIQIKISNIYNQKIIHKFNKIPITIKILILMLKLTNQWIIIFTIKKYKIIVSLQFIIIFSKDNLNNQFNIKTKNIM